MPARLDLQPRWAELVRARDNVATAEHLLAIGFSRRMIQLNVQRGRWQRLLPTVYLLQTGAPYRRQLIVGALLWAGPDACIDGVDACRFAGLEVAGPKQIIRVAAPEGSRARSRGFVRVRRSAHPLPMVVTEYARYLAPPAAVIAAARELRNDDAVLALISQSVQRRIVTVDALSLALTASPLQGRRTVTAAIEAVRGGAHSVPEATVRAMMMKSPRLLEPVFNRTLRLPTGQLVSPDALIPDSGVVHEVNGRRFHEREDLFDSMQARHDAMTTAGLTLLHNSPRRIRAFPEQVLREIEQTHARYAGRGLPAGVELLPAN